MDDERIRLILDLAQSSKDATEFADKLKQVGDAAEKAGDGLGDIDVKAAKATKGTADFNRTAIEGSRILQDFAQGGLGGVINNLEGFASAIGLSGGAAGAITALGVAALVAAPAIKSLWKSIVDGSNEVPKAADNLTKLSDELKVNKDRLKELADQGKLTNTELAEFNKLTAENIQLEKASNAEKERRNTLDAMRKKEQGGDAEAGEIATAAVTEAGGVDKVIASTASGLTKESQELQDAEAALRKTLLEWNAKLAADPLDTAATNQIFGKREAADRQGVAAARSGIAGQAEGLVARAGKGDQDAIRELARLNPNGSFGQATPEGMQAADDFVQVDANSADRLSKGSAKRRASNAIGDTLTRAGQENEAFGANADRDAEDKAASKARDVFDKAHEGAMKAGDDFQKFADKQGPKLDDVRERAGLGIEFRQFAQDQGADPTKTQVAEAAKSIQDMMAHGIDKDATTIQALQQVVNNQMRMSGEMAAQKAQLRNIHQRARAVGTQMTRNRPG